MQKHDPDDVYWNRYRERSSAEIAHHARKLSAADNSKPLANEVEVGSTEPPTNEAE